MRLILAAADRDLLNAYGRWFGNEGIPTELVFDAVQLNSLIGEGDTGLCVLDDRLPLMRYEAVHAMLDEADWRVITLSMDRATDAEAGVLQYPFTPQELVSAASLPIKKGSAAARE